MTEIRRANRWVTIWVSIAAVLLIALAATTLALIASSKSSEATTQAKAASAEAKHIAECVNAVLAARAPATSNDSKAELAFVAGITNFLTESPTQQQKDYPGVLKTLQQSAATLQTDQGYRDQHPLGKC